MLTYWRIYFEKKKKYANISLSIESVRGTAPLTTQQPTICKVLMADRWCFKNLFNHRKRWFFLTLFGLKGGEYVVKRSIKYTNLWFQ